MNLTFKSILKLAFVAVLATALQTLTACASDSFKTIQNPGGGTIVWGPLSGQLSYQGALGETLKSVEANYGDKPQMGDLLQSKSGSFWEGFFTITDKKHGSKPMTGLVIVYAPPSGMAGGATMIDTTDHFAQSLKPMFQLLVQDVTNRAKTATAASSSSGGSAVASAPAQPLNVQTFPDGSAQVGLPQGWKVAHAQQGDLAATGPNGESLRFGLRIETINSTAGRGSLMGIPYNADAGTLFTQMMKQAAQMQRQPQPTITITNTQSNGPQDFFVFATMDKNDGKGAQTSVAHLSRSVVMMNQYQITISNIVGPEQVMQQESATVAAIFSSYTLNTKVMMAITNNQIQQGLALQRATTAMFQQSMADSDRTTQGMSDYLRGESVFVDNDTGQHYRSSDDLAGALSNANPNRFTTLSPGQYLQGVDF